MNELERKLNALVNVVLEKAKKDAAFEDALRGALGLGVAKNVKRQPRPIPVAVLDPIALAQEGKLEEGVLCELSEQQLRDIITVYGLDLRRQYRINRQKKDWLVDFILKSASEKAKRGEAFRQPVPEKTSAATPVIAPVPVLTPQDQPQSELPSSSESK